MGRSEGLVQVQVDNIKTKISRFGLAQDGIQVGPVIIHKGVDRMGRLGYLFHIRIEQAQGIGIGHHHPGHLLVQHGFKGPGVHDPLFRGHGDHLITGYGRAGRIGAVGRARDQDHGFLISPIPMIGGDEHHPG